MTTVTMQRLSRVNELFCHYADQQRPQECYLVVELETGVLTARYAPSVGWRHVPGSVFDRRTLWVPMACLTADAANDLMEDVLPLARRIVAGATIRWVWDQWVVSLSADAEVARDLLAARCDPQSDDWSGRTVEGRDAHDWYLADLTRAQTRVLLGITADTTDAQLAELAAAEEQALSSDGGHVVLRGTEEFFRALREDARREPVISRDPDVWTDAALAKSEPVGRQGSDREARDFDPWARVRLIEPEEIGAEVGAVGAQIDEQHVGLMSIATVVSEGADRYEGLSMAASTVAHLRGAAAAVMRAGSFLARAMEGLDAALDDVKRGDGRVRDAGG